MDFHASDNFADTFSTPMQQVDPMLYEEIFGRPCEHHFVLGGYGASGRGWNRDGSMGEGIIYGTRVQAVGGVLKAYERVRHVDLARRSFGLVDFLAPAPRQSSLQPDRLTARALVERLAAVQTPEQWQEALDDVTAAVPAEVWGVREAEGIALPYPATRPATMPAPWFPPLLLAARHGFSMHAYPKTQLEVSACKCSNCWPWDWPVTRSMKSVET